LTDSVKQQVEAILEAQDDLDDMIDRVVMSHTRWDDMVHAFIRAECARIDDMVASLPLELQDKVHRPWRDPAVRGLGRW
jgi:hypothetical protein